MIDWEIGKFLKVVLVAQLATFIAIFLDIPFARQTIGFFYLSFLPGIILLRVFRIHKKNLIEVILLSVGLSIAFLMFCGLLANEIFQTLGIRAPLSPQFLLPIIIGLTLTLSAFAFVSDRNFSNNVVTKMQLHKSALLLFCLPLFSILGAMLLNNLHNNSISLIVVIAISGLTALGVLSKKIIPESAYPWALLAVAISLLFLLSFTSMYVIGYDVQTEYYIFSLTKTNFHWAATIPSANLNLANFNSMLSITILPTIYSYVLSIDSTWTLKIIYPLIFSLTSLALYEIYRKQFGKRIAFLSTFFFLSFNTFFDQMLGLTRQMIGELFLVLLILLLLERKMDRRKSILLSMIFGAALVVSHYSVSYIFMFFIFVTCIFLPKLTGTVRQDRTLTWNFVSLFSVMAFSWYMYTAAPLTAVTSLSEQISNGIVTEVLDPMARSSQVTRALGMGSSISMVHEIGRIVFQLVQFFIFLGIASMVFKRRKRELDPEYYSMALISMALLIMCILLPYLASGLMMTRIYHITLIILAPFSVLGGEVLFGWIPKLKHLKLPLTSIVLIAFFLFQSGFAYEVTGDIPSCGALSKYRIDPVTNMALYVKYVHEQDVFSAVWLSQNKASTSKIYSDRTSNYGVLTSYGMLSPENQHNWAYLLSTNTTYVKEGAYIYLGNLNIVYGLAEGPMGDLWNISKISPILDKYNLVYSNGASSIFIKGG